MRKSIARIGSVLFAVSLGLAACGGDEDPSVAVDESAETDASASSSASEAPDGGDEASGEPNDADVTFTQSMIVHHEQAIEMAALADGRAESDQVLDLAGRIEAAQQPEIDLMMGWLEEWGEEPMAADHGMDMSEMGMSEEQMTQLEGATGPAFDRMFLEMMTEHHQGAIDMAETEVASGSHPEVIELAEKVIADQTAEIEEMQALLELL